MTLSAISSTISVIQLEPTVTKAHLIELFSIPPTTIKVIFTVDYNRVFLSKGMVALQNGQVELHDIYRALTAATKIPNSDEVIFQNKSDFIFDVDDQRIKTNHHPIGVTGRVLSVGVCLVGIPAATIETIKVIAEVFQHQLLDISINEVSASVLS